MKKLLTLLFLALTSVACTAQPYALTSDKSDLKVSLECIDGALTVDLCETDGGKSVAILSKSPIKLEVDGVLAKFELLKSTKTRSDKTLPMLYGEFSQVELSYSDMVCGVKVSAGDRTYDGTLTVRLFDDTFAYRIELKGLAEGTTLKEVGSYIPAKLTGGCFSSNGEHEPVGPVAIAEAKKMHRTPFIYSDGEHVLSFHECDLFNYPQLVIQGAEDGSAINIKNSKAIVEGDFSMPWRVVMVGRDFTSLHNQKPIYQALSRDAEGDYSWVKPGISMWDWRVKGTTFNGFKYEMTTESLKRYIDFCSKSNIAYFIVDDEWFTHENPLKPVESLDIKEVVRYGKQKNVGIILYYDMVYVKKRGIAPIDFETVAKTYYDFGVAGMKYGFLSSPDLQTKTNMTHNIITTLGKYKLVVDFHDGPIPFSGMERTYPNYLNREYCHAQLDRRAAFTPGQFVKMACVNLLAGHMDQTNGTFALNEMATRTKGPRNAYNSTVSAEAARVVFTHTGTLSVIIDAPEAYEQKSDLFNVIASIPAKWDETKYLEMEFASHVAVAKRAGTTWFTSVIYNEKGGEYKLELDFLSKGDKYTATIYRDAEDTDFKTNKESYKIESREVTSKDDIKVKVPAGGGFTVIFEKK